MKYRLLKDLPTIKAGAIFQEIVREVDGSKILKEYDSNNKITILVNEIKNFDEWFEQSKEEPFDSIHWKPKNGEKIWYLDENGNTRFTYFEEDSTSHLYRLEFGNIYRTSGECEKARERRLVKVRLQQTSTFKPDFKSGNGGWIVCYDHKGQLLFTIDPDYLSVGDVILYSSKKEAEKSIEENREDWLIYFGIDPSDTNES